MAPRIREIIPRHGFDDANRPSAVVLRKPFCASPFEQILALPQRHPARMCRRASRRLRAALHTGLWWSRQHHGLAISASLGVDFALSLSIVLATAIG
jgi:hypothetical protein